VLFTSANAVRYVVDVCGASTARQLVRVPACAIGPKTAQAARAHGWDVVLIPDEHHGAGLARAYVRTFLQPQHVLIPRARVAHTAWIPFVRAAGHTVTEAIVYETCAAQHIDALASHIHAVDGITLASPSAIDRLVEVLGLHRLTVPLFCIGETTAAAVRAHGLTAACVSETPQPEAFAAAIDAWFFQRGSSTDDH
jgi:uroporphyrinogen III methyltransferase/synthase